MIGRRVLVVDDSDVTRTLIARTLTRAGFKVLEACNGIEGAVAALRELPDVVVTDLDMPTMDGYQLLRLLKSDPASKHIPVLILTSHGEAAWRFWGRKTGAEAYLTKDYSSDQFVEVVARLADHARPEASVGEAAPQGPVELLARVARQLDHALMQATLTNTILEHGMEAPDLHDTIRSILETVAEVVDADFLAFGINDEEAALLHVVIRQPIAVPALRTLVDATVAIMEVENGIPVDLEIDGERHEGGEGGADPEDLATFPVPLRDAAGLLALRPRDRAQFATTARELVETLIRHMRLIIDNARLAQRLRELSMRDGLTGLLNHRTIHERLTEELERAKRYGHHLSVAICDLDLFKHVNDEYGHLSGDAVLRATAAAMRRIVRAVDTLGRYGGEEFVILFPEIGLQAARQAAERIRQAIADAVITVAGGATLRVTGSLGVATRSELGDAATTDALLRLADKRLYEAKAAGRNCVRP